MRGIIFAVIIIVCAGQMAWASIYANRKQAFEVAFPGADAVEETTFFLTDAQVKKVQEISHQKVDSKLFTFFIGKKRGKVIGYAAIDNHIVRTMPEVFMAALSPEGRVTSVQVLSFSEPPEYLPSKRWFGQFVGKFLSPDLKLRKELHSVTGATMSSRAITAGVRKILALFHLLVKNEVPAHY